MNSESINIANTDRTISDQYYVNAIKNLDTKFSRFGYNKIEIMQSPWESITGQQTCGVRILYNYAKSNIYIDIFKPPYGISTNEVAFLRQASEKIPVVQNKILSTTTWKFMKWELIPNNVTTIKQFSFLTFDDQFVYKCYFFNGDGINIEEFRRMLIDLFISNNGF